MLIEGSVQPEIDGHDYQTCDWHAIKSCRLKTPFFHRLNRRLAEFRTGQLSFVVGENFLSTHCKVTYASFAAKASTSIPTMMR